MYSTTILDALLMVFTKTGSIPGDESLLRFVALFRKKFHPRFEIQEETPVDVQSPIKQGPGSQELKEKGK